MSKSTTIAGVTLTDAAVENINETGTDVAADLAAIRSGEHTAESLLAECLNGADDDRVQGWREYVAAVADRAETLVAARLTVGGTTYEIREEELGMGREGNGYQVRQVTPVRHIYGNPKASLAGAMVWLTEVVTDQSLMRVPDAKLQPSGALGYHSGDERSIGAGPEKS